MPRVAYIVERGVLTTGSERNLINVRTSRRALRVLWDDISRVSHVYIVPMW